MDDEASEPMTLRAALRRARAAGLLAAALALPSAAYGAASEWRANPQAKVRLLTPWQVAPRQGPLRLGLHFQLTPGWHVYWKNAGDAGYPPALTLQPKDVVGEPEMLWPAPERYELPGGLVAFGYEKEVVYPVVVPFPGPAGEPSLPLVAEVDYLVCRETCIPYRVTLNLDQPLGDLAEADPTADELIDTYWRRLPKTLGEVSGVQANGAVDARDPAAPVLEIRILGPAAEPGKAELFLEAQDDYDVGRPTLRTLADGLVFRTPLKPRTAGKPLPANLSFAWTATGLRKGKETFSLEAKGPIPVTLGEAAAPPPLGAGGGRRALVSKALRALWAGIRQLATPAPLALLLGLFLAVRPALPSRGAGVDGAPAEEAKATKKPPTPRESLAAAATGVIAGSWVVAALAAWARLQRWPLDSTVSRTDPLLAGALAALALSLALHFWGMVPFFLAPPGSPERPQGTGKLLVAGLLLAPLALAWPLASLAAPFADAEAHGPVGLAVLLAATGLGLAAPLLLAVAAPGLLRLLPPAERPWHGGLRILLGFLAAAGVLHLLSLLAGQVRPEGVAFLELALLGAGLCAWFLQRLRPPHAPSGTRRPLRALFALVLLIALASAPWLAERFRFAPRQPVPPFETPLTLPGGFVR